MDGSAGGREGAFFPRLGFALSPAEKALLREDMLKPGKRNVSLDADGVLHNAAGSAAEQKALAAMIGRFRAQALQLVDDLLPAYRGQLRVAPTSFRPKQVEVRAQSVRADDQRMHVDAFPTRPTYGERILRVFTNVNPQGAPRVWRVGDSFEAIARKFLPSQTLPAVAGPAAQGRACDQVAAQRIRPPHAAAARLDEI